MSLMHERILAAGTKGGQTQESFKKQRQQDLESDEMWAAQGKQWLSDDKVEMEGPGEEWQRHSLLQKNIDNRTNEEGGNSRTVL